MVNYVLLKLEMAMPSAEFESTVRPEQTDPRGFAHRLADSLTRFAEGGYPTGVSGVLYTAVTGTLFNDAIATNKYQFDLV